MRTRGTASVIRSASLIALGELGVHQLRYLLAYGGGTTRALREQGHAYLAFTLPLVAALALSLVAGTLIAAALGRGASLRPRAQARWWWCSAALLLVFTGQELAESMLASGHPAGPAAFLANGGWLALPLAAGFGALVSRLLRRIEAVHERLASRPARRPRSPRAAGRTRPRAGRPLTGRVLALGLASRPPPLFA
jgi:hypothetical protein